MLFLKLILIVFSAICFSFVLEISPKRVDT